MRYRMLCPYSSKGKLILHCTPNQYCAVVIANAGMVGSSLEMLVCGMYLRELVLVHNAVAVLDLHLLIRIVLRLNDRLIR